jgi:hypothetical protein
MFLTEGIVLGHHIFSTGIRVYPAKIDIISQIKIPSSQKEFRNLLGHVGYYRRFIQNFTNLDAPLFKLLKKDVEFFWNEQCQIFFEILKTKLSSAPVLRGPNWSLPFHICTDASNTSLGDVLGQREGQIPYAIYFFSKNLSPAEVNYIVMEKEFLSVVHAINKFRHYIIGYKVFVHTDHSAIIFLMINPVTNDRVTRWLLLLQEFNITIIYRPGRDNLVVDFLSRLIHTGDSTPVDDDFPDENLFVYFYLHPLVCKRSQLYCNWKAAEKYVLPRETKNYSAKCQLYVA